MARPGWFPDPGGQPGMFRYWNGTAWTDQLSANPGGETLSGTGSSGEQASGGRAGDRTPSGGQRNRTGALLIGVAAAVALLLLAILVLPRAFGGDPSPSTTRAVPTGSPTVSAWDETSRPTPTPTPTPTPPPTPTPTPTPTPSPRTTSLPCPRFDKAVVNGRLYGGALSVPVIDDSRWSVIPVRLIPWAVCATGLQRKIVDDWVSEVILAGIQPRALTGTLQQQAEAIAEDSVERFYIGQLAERRPLSSQALTIGGLQAWELRYEVRIDYRGEIPGDNVNVLVVQHTDGSRSAFLSFVTIGDTQTQRQVDACRTGLRIEKR